MKTLAALMVALLCCANAHSQTPPLPPSAPAAKVAKKPAKAKPTQRQAPAPSVYYFEALGDRVVCYCCDIKTLKMWPNYTSRAKDGKGKLVIYWLP